MQQTKDQEWLLVDGGNLEVCVTREADAVEEAQRLRFDIFGREMGAGIHGENGRDIDHYDEFCRHLIVRDKTSGRIIGTYRLITEEAAKAAGGWYSDSEFDLSRIRHILPKTVELGRACVHKDYRTGGTISLLWMGLISFMQAHGLEYMIGCGSVQANPLFARGIPCIPESAAAAERTAAGFGGGSAAPDEGLSARRRVDLRRAALGQGFRQCRYAGDDADGQYPSALCQAFC